VDNNRDGQPDAKAGEREVSVRGGGRAEVTFQVTIECHPPRVVGDLARVDLIADLEHVGGGEPAGALGNNRGSASSDVRVVAP
jgi:hypothetical protein